MKTHVLSTVPKTSLIWPKLSFMLANWRARKSLRELMYSDDWLLKDIGLTRNEVAWAMSLPLSVNPAEELNKLTCRGRLLNERRRLSPKRQDHAMGADG